jgi:hypothetical protein
LGVQAAALEVGKKLGALCKEKGISTVVFDRGGFMYHGRIAVSPSPGRLFPLVWTTIKPIRRFLHTVLPPEECRSTLTLG